jgi:hypothetical protein
MNIQYLQVDAKLTAAATTTVTTKTVVNDLPKEAYQMFSSLF